MNKITLAKWLIVVGLITPRPLFSATIDIVFALDASGSVGTFGWGIEKDFVIELIEGFGSLETTNPSNDYRFGIVQFSDQIKVTYNLNEDQTIHLVTSAVQDMTYLQGRTYTKSAIQTSIDLFASQSSNDAFKHIILITDGNPSPASSQDPCGLKSSLDSSNINTSIVGVGSNWSSDKIDCLVDDPSTDIFSVAGFSASNFAAITQNLIDHVVPTPSPVPIPAALWLFGTALIGLVGFGKRRKTV